MRSGAAAVFVALCSSTALADASLRIGLAGGPSTSRGATSAIFDFAPRVDFLSNKIADTPLQLGALAEYRTASFASSEFSGGPAAVWRLGRYSCLLFSPGAGWAARKGASGALVSALLTYGFRVSADSGDEEGYAFTDALVLSYRHSLGPVPRDELTLGIEFGLGTVVAGILGLLTELFPFLK